MPLTVSCLLMACAIATCVSMLVVSRPLRQDFLDSSATPEQQDLPLPPAAVILCVRGADPTLEVCLDGLFGQDYPDMEIHVVLDCDSDPAAEVVHQAIAYYGATNVVVHVLQNPDSRRGLKVSAILQALQMIPQRFQGIAFLDADAEPHPHWLRDLVVPLQSAGIGATSGVRWFDPVTRNPGSLIRAKWNLYAVSLMRYFNIAWGGSFAIRRDVLEQSRLLDRWSETLCEDTCVGDTLASAGYQVRLVSEVSMINRESTTVPGCLRFMTRQLVFTRLHSRNWLPILLLGLSVSVISLLVPLQVLITALQGDVAACLVAGLATAVLVLGIGHFEHQVSALTDQLADRQQPCQQSNHAGLASSRSGLRRGLSAAVSNYLCQMACVVVSGIAFLAAAFARKVEWRGIEYRMHRSQVKLVKYAPFIPATDAEPSLQSISI